MQQSVERIEMLKDEEGSEVEIATRQQNARADKDGASGTKKPPQRKVYTDLQDAATYNL